MRRDHLLQGDTGTAFGTRARGESGYIFAMMGLLMIPLVIMTAFAIDLGSWYAQGQKMQRSADAASLAGVVWANDGNRWDTVAREVAARNGYTDGVNGVVVDVQKLATNQVRVTIRQDGEQYFSKIVLPSQRLNRDSTAEFVLPVPLGSPRNYIGTGGLGTGAVNTAYEKERLWAAVSGQCTDRYQGDRIAARYFDSDSQNDCVGLQNNDYATTNYEYYIELPATRSYNTDVIIYHGNFVRNGDCGGTANVNTPNEFCPAGNGGKALMPTTMTLYRADNTPLDDTDNPTMASQNACTSPTSSGFDDGTKVFNAITPVTSAAESNYDFNPSPGNFTDTGSTSNSSWYRLCQIPSGAPGGKYILRVRNQNSTAGAAAENTGSNAFSIVATPAGSSQQLCDARTDVNCPKVYAKEFLSIFALQNGTANFFLAEIGEEHAGKKVTIGLWDSAEGATSLEIMRPTGTNSWTPQQVSYTSQCGPSLSAGATGTNVMAITNGGAVLPFNGCLLNITFTLPANYDPPDDNEWWRIRYVYNSGATDRTTWSVGITGDPVHLVD